MTTFAQEFQTWRMGLGWTQEQAAECLGLPLATIRNYEQGRTKPQHETLVRIAMEFFGARAGVWRRHAPVA